MSDPSVRLLVVKYPDIAAEIAAGAEALNYEVKALADIFSGTQFLSDHRNFPHAHYGYLMSCMAQIDLTSRCEYGIGEPEGGQSARMLNFMERYLDSAKTHEHRVAIQLMRHTLMHTGALRFLYDPDTETAYTWRVHFYETPQTQFEHYTLTVEDSAYQDQLLASVDGPVSSVMTLNLRLTTFADDIVRVATAYTTAMSSDPVLRSNCEDVYPGVIVQRLKPDRRDP